MNGPGRHQIALSRIRANCAQRTRRTAETGIQTMSHTPLLARVIGLALVLGSVAPALAQRGPPERGERDRSEARENETPEERAERRARRGRGEAAPAPLPSEGQRTVPAPAPYDPRSADVRQDGVARERNAQREAQREAIRLQRETSMPRQADPRREDAAERGRQQREAAIQAARDAEQRQQAAQAREVEERYQVERRPMQPRPDRAVDVQQPGREGRRDGNDRRDGDDDRRYADDRRGDDGRRGERDRRYDDDRRFDGERRGDGDRHGGSRGRLPERDRQRLIVQQRQSVDSYRRAAAARHVTEQRRIGSLQQQRRMQQYRYQQRYWQRHREMQNRWATLRIDFNSDPYFYTPASYRYQRGGRYYEVNRYAAEVLEQAIQFGYEEGVRAGEADRYDGWRGGYRDNFAYLDANYGYDGYYVSQAEYNHYFREGFRRGYEDGYGRQYRYGQRRGDDFLIMASVLQLILGLEEFR
jgi:hypothetical protein